MNTYDLKKISALPSAGTINSADIVPIVQGGVTKKTTFQVLQNTFGSGPGGGAATVIEVVVAGSDTVVFGEGVFLQAIVFTGADGAVQVGLTASGTEIVDDAIAGKPLVYSLLPDPFFPAGVTLHFTGTFTARIFAWAL